MKNAKIFGSVLAAIRKEQGFPGAHQFFKSVGGSKSLGLAFVSYWDMERGKKLPKSWRLKAIMAALGIEPRSPRARELVRAYFKALSGSDELVNILSAPVPAAADLSDRALAEAATQALAQRSVNVPLEKWKSCTRDMVTTICEYYIFNTAGWVTVGELSEATGFKPQAIRKALRAVASAGYLDFAGDRARTPLVDKVHRGLPDIPETAAIKAALRSHWKTWLAGSEPVAAKRMTARMTKAGLDIYRQHLEKAVNLAAVYENPAADRQDSAIYYIDVSIFDIFSKIVRPSGGA